MKIYKKSMAGLAVWSLEITFAFACIERSASSSFNNIGWFGTAFFRMVATDDCFDWQMLVSCIHCHCPDSQTSTLTDALITTALMTRTTYTYNKTST